MIQMRNPICWAPRLPIWRTPSQPRMPRPAPEYSRKVLRGTGIMEHAPGYSWSRAVRRVQCRHHKKSCSRSMCSAPPVLISCFKIFLYEFLLWPGFNLQTGEYTPICILAGQEKRRNWVAVRIPRIHFFSFLRNASIFIPSTSCFFFRVSAASKMAYASSQYLSKNAQLICCLRPHVTQTGPIVVYPGTYT